MAYKLRKHGKIQNTTTGDDVDPGASVFLVPLVDTTPVAYTQTYSTAAETVPAALSAVVLTGTNIAAKTASLTLTDAVNTNAGTVATSLDQAQKDLGTAINTAQADILALKKLINSIIDLLQAAGLAA